MKYQNVILFHSHWYKYVRGDDRDSMRRVILIEQDSIYLKEFQQARITIHTKPQLGMQIDDTHWILADRECLFMDIDANFNTTTHKDGIRAIVRNWRWIFLAALARPILHPHSS